MSKQEQVGMGNAWRLAPARVRALGPPPKIPDMHLAGIIFAMWAGVLLCAGCIRSQMAAERALSQAVCQALSPAVDLMKFPKVYGATIAHTYKHTHSLTHSHAAPMITDAHAHQACTHTLPHAHTLHPAVAPAHSSSDPHSASTKNKPSVRPSPVEHVCLLPLVQAVMDISIMVLEKGGGEVGAAITAASAALADAGVEMRDVTPGCHVVRAGGQVLLDPGSEEGCKADASLLLAAMPTAHVSGWGWEGVFTCVCVY